MLGLKKQTGKYAAAAKKLELFALYLKYYNQKPNTIRLKVVNQLVEIER